MSSILALLILLGAALVASLMLLGIAAREHRVRKRYISAHPVVAEHLAVYEEQLRNAQRETERLQEEIARERAHFLGRSTDDERRIALRVQAEVRARQYRNGGD